MKKSIILPALLSLLAVSCTDFLTKVSPNAIESEYFFTDESSLQIYTNGLIRSYATEIKDLLDSKKLHHTEGVMYRTVANDLNTDEPFDFDLVVFFSPSGVHSLLKNYPDFKQGEMSIATFGPTTAKAVKEAGLRLDLEAPTPQYPSITSALKAFIEEHNKKH